MARAHDIGKRHFWHWIWLQPKTPFKHKAATMESGYPFRVAEPVVIRLIGRLGITLGEWHKVDIDDDDAIDAMLVSVMGGEIFAEDNDESADTRADAS